MSSITGRIFASVVLLVSCAAAQEIVFVPSNDVVFRIAVPRTTYRIGESIEITYTIRNVSRAPILVPRDERDVKCLGPIHFSAWLEDSHGKHNTIGFAGSCIGSDNPSLEDKLKKGMVTLKPGQIRRSTFTLETRPLARQLAPGSYRLEASLSGWRSDYFGQQEQKELVVFHRRVLTGEVPTSTTVILTK